MVNLILDTQIWIYLAKGFNQDTKIKDEEAHFLMVKWILEKIEAKKCRIFSNYIIKIEWKRNKMVCNERIVSLERQITNKKNELKNKRKSLNYLELAKEFRKTEKEIKEKISKNKNHIQTIDKILANSIDIRIDDKHKLMAVDLAIDKRPPFHNKKNSVADAIIFLSTVDYFYYDDEFCINDTIFISNDTDFSESKKNKKFHPELARMLSDKPIIFETNLAKALELGEEIIAKYQKYLDYLNRDCIGCLMDCKGVEYGMGEVEFNDYVEIKINESGYKYNPNQLLMQLGGNYNISADELKALEKRNYIRIELGECNFCNAIHIRCDCGEEHASYEDYIECGCGKTFSINEGIELIREE
jgi:hypothetical protein